jgi:hypothetical protein
VHPNPRKPTLSTWLVAAALVTCQLTVLRAAEGQVRLADIEAGVHFGFNFSNGEIEDERLGLGAIVPVLGPIELTATFSYRYNFLNDPSMESSGSAWQSYFTARVRPFGRGSFAALGYGLTVSHISVSHPTQGTRSNTEVTDVIVIGLELPLWWIRPFGELYLIDILDRESAVGGNALFGLNFTLP